LRPALQRRHATVSACIVGSSWRFEQRPIEQMKILSYNPDHDGALVYLRDGQLVASIEAEKDSHYRHTSLSIPEVFRVLGELDELPDVLCASGCWPGEGHHIGQESVAGYYGFCEKNVVVGRGRLLGKPIKRFSSSHERSHVLCAFGMSGLAKGAPCYVLLWEGVIGAFYQLDSELGVTKIADVMPEPGHRYALLYGLADPTFDMGAAEFSRFSDAGKLMALASYSRRSQPTDEEEQIIAFLLQECQHLRPKECEALSELPHYNVGLDDSEFRDFAGIFSDRIFDRFFHFASRNLKKGTPLLIAGGCGLNCDWNTKWRESGLFAEVFVPPVANDSGAAIGTAIDAQFYFTGEPKIEWGIYSGLGFVDDGDFDASLYVEYEADYGAIADMLASGLILGWVQGKYEIGPRESFDPCRAV
jgi:predicted NodU family carbamoyl transferase